MKLFESILDFIFPKDQSLLYLESLSPIGILESIPPISSIDNDLIALFRHKNIKTKIILWEINHGNRIIIDKISQILLDTLRIELAERALFENFNNPVLIALGYKTEGLAHEIVSKDKSGSLKYLPGILMINKQEHISLKQNIQDECIILLGITKTKLFDEAKQTLITAGAKVLPVVLAL